MARVATSCEAGKAGPGENRAQAWERFIRDWGAQQGSPFFPMWASAAADEMLSALPERIVVGASVASATA